MTALVARAREVDPLTRRLDGARREDWAAGCGALTSAALVALAGAPLWTPAALAAIGVGGTLLDGAAAALVRRDGRGDDQVIEVEPGALPVMLAELARRGDDLVALAQDAGHRLAPVEVAGLPPVLARWRDLARGLSAGPYPLAERVLAEVRDLCDRGTPGLALDLLEAATALDRVIGGPLAVSVRIGRHRVEYAYRVARDRRQLESYVPRAEAEAAFDRLLADDGRWALHYLGVGGVGKTTLLRHVEVTVAAARGLTVARVDFDYLSASYPGRDPGKLVEAIVHELTVRIERAEQDRWLRSIDEQLDRLRQVAADVASDDPIGPIAWPPFQELLSFVGSLLQSFDRPLLILDTCEELMKLAPVGGRVPSVEATFRLIEELHARCPALRVIFAGRRLLAERGADWRVAADTVARGLTGPRPYLALHEVRGFDPGEAEQALALRLPAIRKGDRALIDAILAASPEDERATAIERAPVAGADGDHEQAGPRYSPFRLAAFGGWVAGEPDLPVARLAGGERDPYIEHRIVRRMGRLEPLLPVVAVLRRFDTAALAAVLGPRADAAATMEELAGHEWIDVSGDRDRGMVLTGKRSVVLPLERFLTTGRPGPWAEARQRVAAALRPRLVAADALRLPPEVVDAALRALPADDAVVAWLAVEAGIGNDWTTARTLTSFLLGEHAAAAEAGTLLGAAVRASHASALIHLEPGVDVAGLWQEVEASAAEAATGDHALDPAASAGHRTSADPPPAWLLMHRARLGLAAAQAWTGTGALAEQVDVVAEVVDELARWNRLDALACSVIAAVEAVVERAEREGSSPGAKLARLEQLPAPTTGAAAFVAMLKVRLQTLAGAVVESRADRRLAWRIVQPPGKDALPATTLDWLPPASLRARLRLEAVRLGFFEPSAAEDEVEPAEDGGLLAPPPAGDRDLDSEHLRAALGLYRDARRRAPPGAVPTWARPVRSYAAHARFPLDAYVVALVGDGRRALDREPDGRTHAARFLATVARATFAMDPRWLPDLVGTDTVTFHGELPRAYAIVDLQPMPLPVQLDAHVELLDAWSTQVLTTREEIEAAIAYCRDRLDSLAARADHGALPARMKAAAALEEIVELSRYTAAPLVGDLPALPGAAELATLHADHVEDVAGCALRAWAAGRLAYPPPESKPAALSVWLAAIARATPRRLAQLAHAEGQLLALRFPDRGLRLLDLAATGYLACDDRVGATAAHLAADVARCRLGQVAAGAWSELAPTLEPAEQALFEPLLERVQTRMARRGPARPESTDRFLAPFERGKRRRPARRKVLASWWQRRRSDLLAWAVVIAAVLAIGGAGWVFVAYGKAWIAAGLRRLGVPHAETSVTGGAALTMLYLLLHLNRPLVWFRDWRRNVRVRKLVVTGHVRRAGADEVAITLEPVDGPAPELRARLARAGRHPTVIGGAAPGELAPALATLVDRCASIYPGPAGVPLVLVIDPGLTAHAWEAVLLGAHPTLADAFAPLRVITVPRPPKPAKLEGTLHASVAIRAQLGKGLAEPGVIHAVGRPVRSAYAIGLDLGDGGDAGALTSAQLAPAGARLVVLQGAPQAATEVPTDGFRTEVGLLRELGAGLIAHGVGQVLIVPPLPLATMTTLQAALAEPHRLDPAISYRSDETALAHAARAHLRAIGDSFHRAAALEVTLMVATTAARGTSFGAIVAR